LIPHERPRYYEAFVDLRGGICRIGIYGEFEPLKITWEIAYFIAGYITEVRVNLALIGDAKTDVLMLLSVMIELRY
jgi:hypothetical protein